MSEDQKPRGNPPPTAGEIALMNIGALGANIPAAMQELMMALNARKLMEGVVSDALTGRGYHSAPSSMLPPEPSRPTPTVKSVNGWLPEEPLKSPPGQEAIAALTPLHDPISKAVAEAVARFAKQAEEAKAKGKS